MNKIEIGSLFTFELSSEKYVLAQIIYKLRNNITVVVYDITSDSKDGFNISDIGNNKIILVLTTMTTFFKIKRWFLLNRRESFAESLLITEFKIETTEGTFSANHKGELLRKISILEANNLNYLKNVSPAVIVNTTKAFYGMIPQDDYYENFIKKK